MIVLEGDTGDVIAMMADGMEARIALLESSDGHFKLAIEGPAEALVSKSGGKKVSEGPDLRENLRQELLFF